jgi:hypothetical protein
MVDFAWAACEAVGGGFFVDSPRSQLFRIALKGGRL